jgi:hypothetical protein
VLSFIRFVKGGCKPGFECLHRAAIVALDDIYYYAHKDGGFCIMAHGGGGADAEYEVSGPPSV